MVGGNGAGKKTCLSACLFYTPCRYIMVKSGMETMSVCFPVIAAELVIDIAAPDAGADIGIMDTRAGYPLPVDPSLPLTYINGVPFPGHMGEFALRRTGGILVGSSMSAKWMLTEKIRKNSS